MSALSQSTRPNLPSELGPEYEVDIGQNVPDPIAVPWSGRRRRKRGVTFVALYAVLGAAILVLAAGIGGGGPT